LAPAVRSLKVGDRPADWLEEAGDIPCVEHQGTDSSDDEDAGIDAAFTAHANADEASSLPPWAAPVRFKVQFTATEEYVGSMNEALDLLSHELPSRDVAEVHARAMQALVAELRKKKRAETDRPRPTTTPRRRVTKDASRNKDANRNRHVPAEVRRQVWTRDDARCGYVDDNGRRCAETARLELHHSVPYANGGAHDAENIQLRCRSHNALAAEQDFGREHIARMSGASRAGAAQCGTRAGSHLTQLR
jgi:5-methylcytosine-specific restriction endonuclease McrA